VERQSADLPPASRSRRRYDTRRLLNEGDPLPSVRNVAAEDRINPLTVLKAYQQLVDEQLVEKKRGLGMFIKAGARNLLPARRTPEISRRAMASDPRHHSAARPHTERISWMLRKPAHHHPTRKRRSVEPMACIEARGLAKSSAPPSRSTA